MSDYFNNATEMGDYFNSFDMFHPNNDNAYKIDGEIQYNEETGTPLKKVNGSVVDERIRMSNFAVTANPSRDPLEELSTKIKEGATALEIGFTGSDKGMVGQGATTPGSFGEEERKAIRTLAQQNKMILSTHATIKLSGFAGFSPDQESGVYRFNDSERTKSQKEVEQTIDFAADTARGGAIVVHTGEFQKDIIDSPSNFGENGHHFESFTGERQQIKEAIENGKEYFFKRGKVVNADTGVVDQVQRDAPLVLRKEEWEKLKGKLHNMGEEIKRIENDKSLDFFSRKEKKDEVTQKYSSEMNREFLEEDKLYDKESGELKSSIYNDQTGDVEMGENIVEVKYGEVLDVTGFNYGESDKFFYKMTQIQQREQADSRVKNTKTMYDEYREKLKQLKEVRDIQKEIQDDTPLEEQWKLLRQKQSSVYQDRMGILPVDYEEPVKYLDNEIRDVEEKLKNTENELLRYKQAVRDIDRKIGISEDGDNSSSGTLKSMHEVALEKSSQTYADLGLHALKKWNEITKADKHGQERRDAIRQVAQDRSIEGWDTKDIDQLDEELQEHALYLAPENMMPEYGYGSHPEELKELITSARQEFAEKLVNHKENDINLHDLGITQDKISRDEAFDLAKKHIKATFDIGHANVWRKYFRPDEDKLKQGESESKQFKNWLTGEIKGLLDEDIIGHVHLTDNFGYADDHVSIGEGGEDRGAPIAEYTKLLLDHAKERGKNFIEPWIAEAGHQGTTVLFDAWQSMGFSLYGRSGTGMSTNDPTFGFAKGSYLTSGYSTGLFNPSSLGAGQNKNVGWSGVPLL